ncbi:MAG: multicopper oxidase domain-containing protein [Jatrophihabitantaceae bacterium]
MLAARVSRLLIAATVAVGSVAYVAIRGGDSGSPAAAATPPTLIIPRGAVFLGFSPRTITINRGQTLTVVNRDGLRHSVTSSAQTPLFDRTLSPGTRIQIPATARLAPGRYPFHCKFHSSMRGTLVVRGTGGGTTGSRQTFDIPLFVPPVRNGASLNFAIKRAYVKVFAHGPSTLMWTYGGTYPGPTIRRTTGQLTRVAFRDLLANKVSVHLHGDHHASKDDGQPASQLISPNRSRTYSYPLKDNGAPEPGGFFYYHDHRMGLTARNNWMGLQGFFIVDDPKERLLRLPGPPYDIPLDVADRSFTAANQLTNPFLHDSMMPMGPTAPPNDATIGNRILVNGRYSPYLNVATHRYRFRLLNGSTFQSYDFRLSGGQPFWQVGAGDSLFPTTVKRYDILLGPAQRADVIVDFRGQYGKRTNLISVPRRNAPPGGAATASATLMQFRVTKRVADASRLPATLRKPPPLGHLTYGTRPTATWSINPAVHTRHGSYWGFNGRPYNPARSYPVYLGDTVRWVLRNNSGVTHYVHLHEEQWQTISRDGRRPPPWELGLQDTWKLDPREWVVVQGTFSDYLGIFMIHCHMLDHEDHGLMAQFKVIRRPARAATARSPRSPRAADHPPYEQ